MILQNNQDSRQDNGNDSSDDASSSSSSAKSRESSKKRHRSRSREDIEKSSSGRKKSSKKDDHRRRSRSRERKHRRSRSRSQEDKKRSHHRSRDKRRESSRKHDRRSRSRDRSDRRRRSRDRNYRDDYRERSHEKEYSVEDRDQRTVLCVQLSASVRQRDLEEFFSSIGKVREVRLIMDNKTRKHKGIAYIEFFDMTSVPLALALNGQRLCGRPVMIQPSMAERNRAAPMNAASVAAAAAQRYTGPTKLYVGSLHFNITEEMLRGIFEPFGRIDKIELVRDPEDNRSKGFGFITFFEADDAKKALEQLNGFELAGRAMKVNHVTDRSDYSTSCASLDSEETSRSGIELGSTGRLHLMAKLAEGTGIQLPQAAVNALQMTSRHQRYTHTSSLTNIISAGSGSHTPVAVATQCFLLTNMFDVSSINSQDPVTAATEAEEIRNDVLDECRKHGGALHVVVDTKSSGNVYVKCPNAITAAACVSALHGRYFSGEFLFKVLSITTNICFLCQVVELQQPSFLLSVIMSSFLRPHEPLHFYSFCNWLHTKSTIDILNKNKGICKKSAILTIVR